MILKKMLNQLIVTAFLPLIAVFTLMISACSPHPGAGNWKAVGTNELNISRIKVVFEGTADIYGNSGTDAKEESIRRCFWSATGKHILQMQCVHSDNTDQKEIYQLTITESGQAKLTQNELLLGLFMKQAEQHPEKQN